MTTTEAIIVVLLFSIFVLYPVLKGFFEGVGDRDPKWIKVPPNVARQHKLYGIKGWLLVFLIGSLLGFLSYLGATIGPLTSAKVDWATLSRVNPNAANFLLLSGVLSLAATLTIFVLALQKHKFFRLVSIWIVLITFPAVATLALVFPFQGMVGAVVRGILPWLISCAVWVSYLQLSRRVRVTFENTIRRVELVQNGVTLSEQYASVSSSSPSSDDWASALDEYESDKRDKGLWAKLYAENNGDEAKTKAGYLSIRAARLSDTRLAESRLSVQSQESGGRHRDILLPNSVSHPNNVPEPSNLRGFILLVVFILFVILVAAFLKHFRVI